MELELMRVEVMDQIKFKMDVKVVDPIKFTSLHIPSRSCYCIRIQTNHPAFSLSYSEVRRRYSEFRWLRNVLQRHHPENKVPSLSSVALLTWKRFSPHFLELRRRGLEKFLNSLIEVPKYLGEKALHLFLQTQLSVYEIDMNLVGKRDDNVTDFQTTPMILSSSSNGEIDCCNSCTEDSMNVLLDDGYCAAHMEEIIYLDPKRKRIVQVNVGNSWLKVNCDTLEGITYLVVGNSIFYILSSYKAKEIQPEIEDL